MKKYALALLAFGMLGFSSAKASQIQLNYIDTNDCRRAQHEVSLLNSASVQVYAECSRYIYRGYGSDQGGWYNFRLTTVVHTPYRVRRGERVRMNDIDTNDCAWAKREISLLNSATVRVRAVCSPYIYQGYGSDQGRRYNYRLYTTINKI